MAVFSPVFVHVHPSLDLDFALIASLSALRHNTTIQRSCAGQSGLRECFAVRLEPLYRIRFAYPEGWAVGLGGEWEQHFYLAEGHCEGTISGRFRGANYPRRRNDGTFRPDFRAVIETEDGATIMFEWHGYGRAYPIGRRQIVGAVFHSSDDERYRRLNDVVCVCAGEVRGSGQVPPELVVDVAELVWEEVCE